MLLQTEIVKNQCFIGAEIFTSLIFPIPQQIFFFAIFHEKLSRDIL